MDVWATLVRTRCAALPTLPAHGVVLTPLQEEGAARAALILARYGGVIVADSVGMGKTFVALRLAAQQTTASATLVIVPATLRSKWRRALAAAGIDARVVSHTQLAAHTDLQRVNTAVRLLIVDEAHQFRNPATARYRALARLATHARVVLLTATPVNNRLDDLYWLLRLFLGDGDLRQAGVPDLRAALLGRRGAARGAARRVTAQVVVRRSRADLGASQMRRLCGFPRRARPVPLHYDLGARYPELAEVAMLLDGLHLAPLRNMRSPRGSACGADALVKLGLIKRLESSVVAFHRSIERLLAYIELCITAEETGGWVPPRVAHRAHPEQLSFTSLIAVPLPRTIDRARLREVLQHDRAALEQLAAAAVPARDDPKIARLALLLAELGRTPSVVFTQYSDTADALFATLHQTGVGVLHANRAEIAGGRLSRRALLECFAPRAAGCPPPAEQERVITLVATDVLSEGLDLQDAQHCISYDLPWNPVRLMQRVGRIDRMHSPHDVVYSWYFQPTGAVDEVLRLLERLRRKIRTIQATVGDEAPVLAARARTRREESRAPRDVFGALRSIISTLPPVGHPDATASEPAHVTSANAAVDQPVLAACVRCDAVTGRLALIAASAGMFGWWEAVRMDGAHPAPAALTEREIGRILLSVREKWTAAAAGEECVEQARSAVESRRRSCGTLHRAQVTTAAARLIRRRLATYTGGAPPDLCARAEQVLRKLRRGLPVARERALAAVVRENPPDIAILLDRIDALAGARRTRGAGVHITAVLLVEGRTSG